MKRGCAVILLAAGLASPALAQKPMRGPARAPVPTPAPALAPAAPVGGAPGQAPAPRTAGAMAELIRLLVAQKTISEQAGNALLAELASENHATQAQLAQAQAELQSTRAQLAAASPAPAGTVRVPYVPQVVKDQIRDELKSEVVAQAKTEGWLGGARLPEWLDRITVTGDIRFRDEFQFYSKSNSPDFIDYARFNANGPTDVNANVNLAGIPFLNTQRDRDNRLSVRARLAVDARLSDKVIAGIRLASGDDRSPVSTTQLLGGGFGKKDIWLDRAFIGISPTRWSTLSLGRFSNPYWSTDLLYDEDLNFDGAALALRTPIEPGGKWGAFTTLGAFAFGYGSTNFPTNSQDKGDTRDKYIFGGQIGGSYYPTDTTSVKLAAAYYDFSHVQGKRSDPCTIASGNVECSTDETRPAFLSKGNTLFLLRDLQSPTGDLNFTQPQFVGLAFKYRLLDVNAEARAQFSDRWVLTVSGDFVDNLGFRRRDLCGLPLATNVSVAANGSSIDPCGAGDARAPFFGQRIAWMARAGIGTPSLTRKGDWAFYGTYKRVGSDSMLDSLTDSDFNLGGTNAKGYILSGNYMLFDKVMLSARYFSANEIAGPPLGLDVLQLDLRLAF